MAYPITRDVFDMTLIAIGRPPRPEEYDYLVKTIAEAQISSKHELALFLANIYHESDGLRCKAEIGGGAGKGYSGGDRYYGHGLIQVTHDYHYRAASIYIFQDERVLLDKPELVEENDWLAWKVTSWFWIEHVKPNGTDSLWQTVRTINSMELDGYPEQYERRGQFLKAILDVLANDGAADAPSGRRTHGVQSACHGPWTGATWQTGQAFHVVKPRDMLDAIGRQYNVPWKKIAYDNNMTCPHQIRPRMKLKIFWPC